MSPLTIPQKYASAMKAIRALSDETANELAVALEGATLDASSRSLKRTAGAVARSIEPHDLSKIIDALVSLGVVLYESDVDLETFAHDVVSAMSELSDVGKKIPEQESSVLERRFQRLLNAATLKSASKAIGLKSDFPGTFCDAKILTDLRPVFGADPKQVPTAAIITHTLKIAYHHGGGRHQEFYVALDASDLDTLAGALERARDKDASLRLLLEKSGIADLDADMEGNED